MSNGKKSKFDANDVELLSAVIDVIPNLPEVAHALRLARKGLKYPVKSRDGLLKLFEGKKATRLGDRTISAAAADQFIPEKFFPIDSERDLIIKLLIAFQIGDIYHTQEIMAKSPRHDGPTELLAGPTYHPGGYKNLKR